MAKLIMTEEGSTPSAPSSGKWGVYAKGTGIYYIDDNGIEARILSEDHLFYKFSVTVVSNDLVVTIQHPDASNPSAQRPLWIRIGNTWRSIVTTTTITIVDGTNFFNSGSAELGTQLVGYFVYAVWDSNSSVVALSISRIPYGRLVSDFSGTNTNEKHLFNHANFTSTDPVVNIGYFEAILSLSGTSHLWTVPTFTNANLKHEPTPETNWLSWTPAWSGLASMTVTGVTVSVAKYQITGKRLLYQNDVTAFTIGGTPSALIYETLPFRSTLSANSILTGAMLFTDSGGSGFGGTRLDNATPERLAWVKYNAAVWGAGAGTDLIGNGWYEV